MRDTEGTGIPVRAASSELPSQGSFGENSDKTTSALARGSTSTGSPRRLAARLSSFDRFAAMNV